MPAKKPLKSEPKKQPPPAKTKRDEDEAKKNAVGQEQYGPLTDMVTGERKPKPRK